ncbi:Uncharacterised protein [uncultured archaeon]|nr:Uncharacterised protein [uncultured archaeon]
MPIKNTERVIIFDSSTLISFAMNGLFEELKTLRKSFSGKFIITKEVKQEIVDNPIRIKRFELEALKIDEMIQQKILELPNSIGVEDKKITDKTLELMKIANNTFISQGVGIKLIDMGETSCVALSQILNEQGVQNVLAVDERTTRMLSENPETLKNIMQKRLHTKINIKNENLRFFRNLKFIRSTELIYVAYKKGIISIKSKDTLDALLYALKFKGCSISDEEIEEIKRLG